jgi:hypothetical protein
VSWFTAPKGHGLNLRTLGGMPGMLLETRAPAYKPEVLQLAANDGGGSREFYEDSLAAAVDVGDMNEASTGKLRSAGLAAKANYALQYADERIVSAVSTEQDKALKRLAKSLDAITRTEYTEARKIRIAGADCAFMPEQEILPEDLDVEVDYVLPGDRSGQPIGEAGGDNLTKGAEGLARVAEAEVAPPSGFGNQDTSAASGQS